MFYAQIMMKYKALLFEVNLSQGFVPYFKIQQLNRFLVKKKVACFKLVFASKTLASKAVDYIKLTYHSTCIDMTMVMVCFYFFKTNTIE